eukprot:TRINITY_DN3357_c0_g1_i1.p1 TRINITY_DN3357_c0_g1~~TRINITY_DN3357_c0_g1_i1.p1  ORF type:complete len:167 (+),score=6.77 TRINITY_DN3357_c0_g1_i1:384-884(+)
MSELHYHLTPFITGWYLPFHSNSSIHTLPGFLLPLSRGWGFHFLLVLSDNFRLGSNVRTRMQHIALFAFQMGLKYDVVRALAERIKKKKKVMHTQKTDERNRRNKETEQRIKKDMYQRNNKKKEQKQKQKSTATISVTKSLFTVVGTRISNSLSERVFEIGEVTLC